MGSYGTVLADDVEQAMLGRGYSMPGVSRADTKVDPVRKMLKFERDLAKQINELLKQYQETQRELRLSPDNIRKVVEVGLALAEQPALIPDLTTKDPARPLAATKVAFIAPREDSRVSDEVDGTIRVELAHGCLHAEDRKSVV